MLHQILRTTTRLVTVVTKRHFRSPLLPEARSGFALAKQRVGIAQRQRLEWLLDFVYLLDERSTAFAESERAQLIYDLAFFTGRADPFRLPSPESIAAIATEVRTAIENLLTCNRWVVHLSGNSGLTREIVPRAVSRAGRMRLAGFESSYFSQDFRNAFLINAADAVEAEATRLGKCARKGCGRIFARHRRASYCSSSCSQKERDSRFRQRHTRTELSRRRHDYYKKRIARERGPAVAEKVRSRTAKPRSRRKS